MKKLWIISLLILANPVTSQVDVYQWCQAQIDMVKNFSTLPDEQLIAIKSSIAKADSIEKLSIATGKDLTSMVPMIQEHQNMSETEARKVALGTFKPIEMKTINEAIAMQGVTDELKWNSQFDKCVYENRDSL